MKTSTSLQALKSLIKGSAVEKLNEHIVNENLTANNSDAGDSKRKSKYGNKKVEAFGMKFHSKKEANYYFYLKQLKLEGKIYNLFTQVEFQLSVCKYIADFTYQISDTHELVVEDVKSKATRKLPVYRIKKKLMLHEKGITIQEI